MAAEENFEGTLNIAWDWSESRDVPMEVTRVNDEWRFSLSFRDSEGSFKAFVLVPYRPKQVSDKDWYTRVRKSLDAACANARSNRIKAYTGRNAAA